MTQYAVARMDGKTPRLFTGRYDHGAWPPRVVTTGRPDRARTYDDEKVATITCAFLNIEEGARNRRKAWAVIPLPEARK